MTVTPDRYDVVPPFDPEGLPEHMCLREPCFCDAPVGECCEHCPAYGLPVDELTP